MVGRVLSRCQDSISEIEQYNYTEALRGKCQDNFFKLVFFLISVCCSNTH